MRIDNRLIAVRPALAVCWALVVFLMAACTVSLAPRYDASIVDGLNDANAKTLALFSALSGGSPKEDFPKYSDKYNEVIGQFEALKLQAEARAVPPLAEKISDQLSRVSVLAEVCGKRGGNPTACVNSTPLTLKTIVANLSFMRDTHRDQGVPVDRWHLFKNAHETEMHLVLTVETALKRD